MQVTQVTVSIHEKRNHPYEYGHYDASVTFHAEVGDDLYNEVVELLRGIARGHVLEECNDWVASIEEQHRIDGLVGRIDSALNRLSWHGEKLRYAKLAVSLIRELPEDMQALWKERLRQGLAKVKAQEEEAAARAEAIDSVFEEEPAF